MEYKIISATGGNFIKDKLLDSKYQVLGDVGSQEELFKVLNKKGYDILIASDSLVGFYNKYAFIKKIKDINKKIRVIMILEKYDEKFEEYLVENEIDDFFRNGDFYFEDIISKINMYREDNSKSYQKVVIKNIDKGVTVDSKDLISLSSQNIFAISGNSGCGKSMFTYAYSNYLAKNSNLNVLVIDLDTEKGDINLFFNLAENPREIEYELPEDKSSSLNYLTDMIDKGIFNEYNFSKCLLDKKGNSNLRIISGNTSLNVCLNTLSPIYYEKILDLSKIKFDVIFIDTSSSLFLDSTQFAACNSTDIIFLIEANKLSVERAKRTLRDICENWNIDKEKIKILINKYKKTSMEKELVKHLLREYEVIGFIPFNEDLERVLVENTDDIPKNIKEEFDYLFQKMGFARKVKLMDKLFLK